jgi:hypothetical protein
MEDQEREAYQQVIQLLIGGQESIDYKGICMTLAKSAPTVFMALHRSSVVKTNGLDTQLWDLMERGEKVQAIKLHRTETGMGLKESKDYCDALQLKPRPFPPVKTSTITGLKELLADLMGGGNPGIATKTEQAW